MYPEKNPSNLEGKQFKVGAIIWPPSTLEGDFNKSINSKHKGIETNLLETIAKAANFTYVYKFSKRLEDVGTIAENGMATGLMKMLLTKKVDIIMGSINPTVNRHKFFDFSFKFGNVSSIYRHQS